MEKGWKVDIDPVWRFLRASWGGSMGLESILLGIGKTLGIGLQVHLTVDDVSGTDDGLSEDKALGLVYT